MSDSNRTRVHTKKLSKQSCNIRLCKHFFSNRVVNVWNALPEDVIGASSVNAFKNKLDSYRDVVDVVGM